MLPVTTSPAACLHSRHFRDVKWVVYAAVQIYGCEGGWPIISRCQEFMGATADNQAVGVAVRLRKVWACQLCTFGENPNHSLRCLICDNVRGCLPSHQPQPAPHTTETATDSHVQAQKPAHSAAYRHNSCLLCQGHGKNESESYSHYVSKCGSTLHQSQIKE
jgi:hypothetical protein